MSRIQIPVSLWITWRFLKGTPRSVSWTTWLAFVGMILGVGCLVVSMSVVSGVQSLLKQSIIEVTGHLLIMKPGEGFRDLKEIESEVSRSLPEMVAMTPFVHVEAVLAHEGTLSGILLQGVDPTTVENVLRLSPRMIEGKLDWTANGEDIPAFVGKEIPKRFGLKLGDSFRIVVPKAKSDSSGIVPRIKTFRVAGVLDFGKFEFNERTVIAESSYVQDLAGIGEAYNGIRVKVKDPDRARELNIRLANDLGANYWVRDWQEVSQNYFSAVELEKIVIFIVLLLMVIVASFNISSTLYVSVLNRFQDMSIFLTMGAKRSFLVRLFVSQGVFVGIVGVAAGLALGVGLGSLLKTATWLYVPAEIYKFDHLPIEYRLTDWIGIVVSSLVITLVSTYGPARKGSRLSPVDGLRYE
ncbi:MAG: ABC transporter permease [Bdellovibrionales bacterium]|nr:ABC transporter permease [Bdellovibrionales bacterium]